MPSYFIEVKHDGLNKYRMIRGNHSYVVEQKAAAQKAAWDDIWKKKCEKDRYESFQEKNIYTAKQRSESAL